MNCLEVVFGCLFILHPFLIIIYMKHKIFISIISILVCFSLFISFSYWKYYDSTNLILSENIGDQKMLFTTSGNRLACNTRIYDKESGRLISTNIFILAKNNECSKESQNLYISKNDFIKEIQSSPTWGVFDIDYNDPILAVPDPKISASSK